MVLPALSLSLEGLAALSVEALLIDFMLPPEKEDVFTVSLGNLPARCDCLIRIQYVTELSSEGADLVFQLPGTTLSPGKTKKIAQEQTQVETKTVAQGMVLRYWSASCSRLLSFCRSLSS